MKTILPYLLLVVFTVTSKAASYTYSPTPADLNDLDHHLAYTWRIDSININPASITGASLTFTSIANWDNTANKLFIHLLDTAKYSGTRWFTDATGAPVPSSQIQDNFAGSLLASNPLVASGTGNILLTSKSFTMTPSTYTYNFTAAQLLTLQAFIANGNNIAFGFDPDCHYFNNGIIFKITVPDAGSTAALFGLAMASIGLARRKFCV